jgi:hypothetical protein
MNEGGDGGGRETSEGIRYPIVERRCPLAPGRLLRTGRVDPPLLELLEKRLVLSPAAQGLLSGLRAGPLQLASGIAGMGIASVAMTASPVDATDPESSARRRLPASYAASVLRK